MAVLTDPVADFLTRFKNAVRAGNEEFRAPFSRMKEDIAKILKEEGYVWGYEAKDAGDFKELVVKPRYENNKPAMTDLKRISRPGRRKYVGASEIPRVLNGLGIAIVSTSKGVMTGSQAKRTNVGGELMAYVW